MSTDERAKLFCDWFENPDTTLYPENMRRTAATAWEAGFKAAEKELLGRLMAFIDDRRIHAIGESK